MQHITLPTGELIRKDAILAILKGDAQTEEHYALKDRLIIHFGVNGNNQIHRNSYINCAVIDFDSATERNDYLANLARELDAEDNNKISDLQQKVIGWAEDKGIFAKATPETQHGKTLEEVRELTDWLAVDNKEQIMDAIGDIAVTLIIQAHMQGFTFIECLAQAYGVISKRTGKMINGVFVKD